MVYTDTQERELDLSELDEWISEGKGIETDPDDLAVSVRIKQLNRTGQAVLLYEHHNLRESMRESIERGDYEKAFSDACELRMGGYGAYKLEAEECIRKCVRYGLTDALIYEVDHYGQKADGSIRKMAFPYLKILAERGYIRSFRRLADCYFYGIGCEKDPKAAERYYFEALLFDCSAYVRDQYATFHPELEDYDGDDEIIKLIRCMVYDMTGAWKGACLKLAQMIMEGKIIEYAPESAYVMLSGWDIEDSDIAELYKGHDDVKQVYEQWDNKNVSFIKRAG